MIVIGIDPGLEGAVAALDENGNVVALQDTPFHVVHKSRGKRREYAEPAMAALLENAVRCATPGSSQSRLCAFPVLVVIENVGSMPKQGVASSFNFGVGFGIWRGIIAAFGLKCERVTPQTWKASFGLHGKQKGASVAKALRLFPRAELGHKHHGRMVYSDGRADALLIAEHARRRLVGSLSSPGPWGFPLSHPFRAGKARKA
jgi:crossover junction endodeoxyribonuclease RuvC